MSRNRIAVLSDIHGNIRALDAVLADITRRGIDRIANLGDCLYGPLDPVPVAERLLATDWPTVSGNEDRILVEASGGRPVSRTARFTAERLSETHLRWLAQLPLTLEIGAGLFACHGTPTDDTQYLLSRPTEDGTVRPATDAEIVEQLGSIDAPLILCGHDHLPRAVRLDDGRTIVNPGSIGCPAYTDDSPIPHTVGNNTPRARYAIVTYDSDSPEADLISVAYNWAAAAAEAESNGFPDWANWLRTGRANPPDL